MAGQKRPARVSTGRPRGRPRLNAQRVESAPVPAADPAPLPQKSQRSVKPPLAPQLPEAYIKSRNLKQEQTQVYTTLANLLQKGVAEENNYPVFEQLVLLAKSIHDVEITSMEIQELMIEILESKGKQLDEKDAKIDEQKAIIEGLEAQLQQANEQNVQQKAITKRRENNEILVRRQYLAMMIDKEKLRLQIAAHDKRCPMDMTMDRILLPNLQIEIEPERFREQCVTLFNLLNDIEAHPEIRHRWPADLFPPSEQHFPVVKSERTYVSPYGTGNTYVSPYGVGNPAASAAGGGESESHGVVDNNDVEAPPQSPSVKSMIDEDSEFDPNGNEIVDEEEEDDDDDDIGEFDEDDHQIFDTKGLANANFNAVDDKTPLNQFRHFEA